LKDYLKSEGLYISSGNIRKGAAAYIAQEHDADVSGGMFTNQRTMLNSKGFNSVTNQCANVCKALNKSQKVKYVIDKDNLMTILAEYRHEDKWYNESGIFMASEWNKLISDIKRFENVEFVFPWAYDDRGRMYDGGSYLSVQGDAFQKRLLKFPEGEIERWDARNSGLQMYSLLGADEVGAKLCGLNGIDGDAYQSLADALNSMTTSTKFTRDLCKKPFMTFLYGAMGKQIMEKSDEAIGHLFPVGMELADKWEMFLGAMRDIAPAAINLMNLIYAFNDENRSEYNWTMPDGFVVNTTNYVTLTYKGHWIDLKCNKTHESSINSRKDKGNKFSRALAPNIIHSIDGYVKRQMIERCTFSIMGIHDSFGALKSNANDLNRMYKSVCIDVMNSNLLENILNQINPDIGFKIKKGGLTPEMIMSGMPLKRD
jgi:DNA-directed RNA polymerase